jgi:glycosyltransferase involved in cell wall biosynthesis
MEASSPDARPDVSIVVPMHNEAPNVAPLCEAVRSAMTDAALVHELILVDDGSTDGTLQAALDVLDGYPQAQVIELRRNFGQAAAMSAGFRAARGLVVAALDGDLQNDPQDIPALVAQLDEPPGFDVVSGWRRNRKEGFWLRRLPSRIANWLISRITGVHLRDYGCTLKAYRREVLDDVRLYGEMHRFIPALVHWVGGRVTEREVRHHPRTAGCSKYGLSRTFRVVLDLLTVKFMLKYMSNPIYFFGKLGGAVLFGALTVLGVVVWQKYSDGFNMTGNPLLYLSVALLIIGAQTLLMGLMMEIQTRTYYESQDRQPHFIRQVHRGRTGRGDEG